jgi:TolA-binding protein
MHRGIYFIVLLGAGLIVPAMGLMGQDRQQLGKPPAPPNDLPLVERVLAARKEYQRSLETLREHYHKQGDAERMRWCEEELLSYHRMQKRAYRLDLDVPPPTLQPAYNIYEANELFRKAMDFKKKGWGGEYEDNVRRAEILLQKLLLEYPQSDKIDDSAYQLGEIYESRVFKHYRRAAVYYERACDWNPNTDTDACLKSARLYDRQLNDRTKAVQMYRHVVTHSANQKHVDEAKKRIGELSAAPP